MIYKAAAPQPKRRTFRVASERFTAAVAARATVGAMEFHAQHNQKDHGNRSGGGSASDTAQPDGKPTFEAPSPAKPIGGGEYSTSTTGRGDGRNYSGRPTLRDGAYLQASTRLQGQLWQINNYPGDSYDGAEPDVMVVESKGGKQRAFIKPTGKIVKANRTRPSLYEFDMFTVDTVARTDASGKSAVFGQPGEYVQKLYTNSDLVKLT